jgi:nucleoside-diphosphate-sugar epimerase
MLNKIQAMKNRKVAITGGAGFIGANLAKELAANNSAIIIDDLSAAERWNSLTTPDLLHNI